MTGPRVKKETASRPTKELTGADHQGIAFILGGDSNSDAYKKAFNSDKAGKALHEAASRWANKPDVKAEIARLRKQGAQGVAQGRKVEASAEGSPLESLTGTSPLERFDAVGAEVVLDLVACGMHFGKIAAELGVSKGWLRRHLVEKYAVEYAAAQQARGDGFAEDALEKADEANPDQIPKAALQVKTYQWYAARANPSKWGDANKIGVAVQVNNSNEGMNEFEIVRRLAFILEGAARRKDAEPLALPAPESAAPDQPVNTWTDEDGVVWTKIPRPEK